MSLILLEGAFCPPCSIISSAVSRLFFFMFVETLEAFYFVLILILMGVGYLSHFIFNVRFDCLRQFVPYERL